MNLKYLFLILSVVCLGVGFLNLGAIVEGMAKGLAGVFFILYYIFMLLGKQPTDKTTH